MEVMRVKVSWSGDVARMMKAANAVFVRICL
jgi:hypothetical protein